MLPIVPLIWVGGLLFAGITILATVGYLDNKKLRDIIREKNKIIKELNNKICAVRIKEIYKKGDYNHIKVGLHDESYNEIKEEVVIKSNTLGSDLYIDKLVYL